MGEYSAIEIGRRIKEAETRKMADDWKPAVPFDNVTVPPFPVDCLPEPLRNYVQAVSDATQTPVDMAAVAGLLAMSLCVQSKYKIKGKPDWIEPLNLYSVVVMNPAERKSAVLFLLTRFISEFEQIYNEGRKEELNRNRAEKVLLEREIAKLIDSCVKGKATKDELFKKQDELTKFDELKPLRLLADDTSPEALTSLLARNGGKIAVVSSEGGIFEVIKGRYSQTVNMDVFLKAHNGDPIRVDRKGRESEYIPEPCLTMLLTVQPQVLDGLINNEIFRGRGLTARFLYCLPASTVGTRKFETPEIPAEHKERYRELCFDLLRLEQAAEPLTLSPEAYRLSATFAEKLEPRLIDELDGMADWAGKLHGAVLRIAGILHIVNQLVFAASTPMPKETMLAAVEIGCYFLEHAKAACQLMGADEQTKDARYVLSKLVKQNIEKATRTEIVRVCRKFKSTEELTEPLELLIRNGYLREMQPTYSGIGRRPEPVYFLNPLCKPT